MKNKLILVGIMFFVLNIVMVVNDFSSMRFSTIAEGAATVKLSSPLPGQEAGIEVPADPVAYIKTVYWYLLGASFLLAMLILVVAGVKWIASAGNAAFKQDAMDMIKNAVFGIVLLFIAILILNTIRPLSESNLGIPKVDVGQISIDGQNTRWFDAGEFAEQNKAYQAVNERASAVQTAIGIISSQKPTVAQDIELMAAVKQTNSRASGNIGAMVDGKLDGLRGYRAYALAGSDSSEQKQAREEIQKETTRWATIGTEEDGIYQDAQRVYSAISKNNNEQLLKDLRTWAIAKKEYAEAYRDFAWKTPVASADVERQEGWVRSKVMNGMAYEAERAYYQEIEARINTRLALNEYKSFQYAGDAGANDLRDQVFYVLSGDNKSIDRLLTIAQNENDDDTEDIVEALVETEHYKEIARRAKETSDINALTDTKNLIDARIAWLEYIERDEGDEELKAAYGATKSVYKDLIRSLAERIKLQEVTSIPRPGLEPFRSLPETPPSGSQGQPSTEPGSSQGTSPSSGVPTLQPGLPRRE